MSDWQFHAGNDFDDGSFPSGRNSKRRRSKEIVEAYEEHTYGGYAYDYEEYAEAKDYLERNK